MNRAERINVIIQELQQAQSKYDRYKGQLESIQEQLEAEGVEPNTEAIERYLETKAAEITEKEELLDAKLAELEGVFDADSD